MHTKMERTWKELKNNTKQQGVLKPKPKKQSELLSTTNLCIYTLAFQLVIIFTTTRCL